MDDDDDNELGVLAWTASRLTAGPEPAYGSASLRDDPAELAQAEVGTVHALPRRRIALDWRQACADDQGGTVWSR